jgi:hypothetical protein
MHVPFARDDSSSDGLDGQKEDRQFEISDFKSQISKSCILLTQSITV